MAEEKKPGDAPVSEPRAIATGSSEPPKPALKKVTLKTAHTHAGERFAAGDEIEVNDADEKWLRENKVI